MLIDQITALDPTFRFDSFGVPASLAGQNRQIGELRVRRAATFLRVRGESRPLQVETLRFLQQRVDHHYSAGLQMLAPGRLPIRLSPREALGNYNDVQTRRDLRELFVANKIEFGRGPIRIIGREYDSSGSDLTYRVPDARVGKIAFDVTLSPKNISTPQVRGFFNADFRPEAGIIIRPSLLGDSHTYAISRPGAK